MKPILITVWPIHLDYPLFRWNLHKFHEYFAGIWIALSEHHQGVDYSNFIMQDLPFARFVNVKHKGFDWRNDAINETLEQIKTDEPILFIEQDFLFTEKFLKKILKDPSELVYHMEGMRKHPAFVLVTRELVEKTSKDFSAYPGIYGDHFSKFFLDLPLGQYLIEYGLRNKQDYFHLNGLSQNYASFKNDQPLYQPHDFLYYNYKCIRLPNKTHPQFLQIEMAIERQYKHPEKHEFLDLFFP